MAASDIVYLRLRSVYLVYLRPLISRALNSLLPRGVDRLSLVCGRLVS